MLQGAAGTVIRGNLISGNGLAPDVEPCCASGFGIWLADSGASGTTIAANLIGTNATGTAAIGNGTYAISLSSSNNTIGGTSAADRNVISGNGRGIQIALPAQNNTVLGNYIGTDVSGLVAVPNGVHGILLNQTTGVNTIGGTAAGSGNVVVASGTGILVANASNTVVQGNRIGVGADGVTPLGNVAVGVQINGSVGFPADLNTIGGTAAGAGNIIARNGVGVLVNGNAATGNRILGNVIRDNTSLGIDVGPFGVTPNDVGDTDTGPNGLQNFPLITGTRLTKVDGTLDSGVGTYRVEIFANATCDASGNGEGVTLLKVLTGVTPGPFAADAFPISGTFLSATATNETTGDTSEFGPCHLVTNGLPAPGTWAGSGTGTTLAAGSGAAGPAQFTYDLPDADPVVGNGEAGSWDVYTTASSAGTINIPWRYTGFHAFFQVTVKLDAFVVGASGPDTQTNLLTAGPANCCAAPSAGFDYSGTASFNVQPGDIYGFTLTGTNGDTNETLRGELLLGNSVPTGCASAQTLYGATTDGRYVINPISGQRFSVHCLDMAGTAKDYLTLPLSGPGANFGSYAAGGAAPGSTVTTSFSKVRLNPATLTVDIGDRTFAPSTGSLTHPDEGLGNPTVTSMPYATAMACNSSAASNGTANVDLRGTIFAVDDTWTPIGTTSASFGGATFSAADQVVNVQGNGNCGWRTPYPEGPFYVFNPAPGQFGLTLRYLNEPVVSLATPVLFASVSTPASSADLYGLVDGAVNTSLDLVVLHGSTCTNGVLSAPTTLPGPFSVTTDAAGYFKVPGVSGIASGEFVAVRVTSPALTDLSGCVRTTADNDYWPKALPLAGTTVSTQDVIEVAGKARWYRIPIFPDQRISAASNPRPPKSQ